MIRILTMALIFLMIISVFKIEIPVANALVMGAIILMSPLWVENTKPTRTNKEKWNADIPDFMKK